MTCALITKQSVDDKGPWSHWVGAAGLSRGKGHPCRGTPIHHQDTHLPDFRVPKPPVCQLGREAVRPDSLSFIHSVKGHPSTLEPCHPWPGPQSLLGPAPCRGGALAG